jgi:hypothetical protein
MKIFEEFISYLDKNGLKYVSYNQSETLSFSLNNLNYLFQWQESDPNYFRIALPNIENSPINNERQAIINQLIAGFKVAKAITMDDGNLWLVAETFVYSSENLEKLFARMIYLLGQIIDEYRNRVRGGAR